MSGGTPASSRGTRASRRRIRAPNLGVRAARVTIAAALFSSSCGGDSGPGAWVEEDGYRWRAVEPRGGGGLETLDAARRGIAFAYDVADELRYENRVLAEGAGVAMGDVDGDGLADLFFAGYGGSSALYRNLGRWRFADVTGVAGVALPGVLARGAALADVDGDGDLDLVVTVHGGRNRLFLNDGEGVFAESAEAGLDGIGASTTAALADIDADGDLDLYVANYKTRQADDELSQAERDGLWDLRPGPDGTISVPGRLAEHYRVEFDGRFVRWWELGERDELYLNRGDGRFVPVALADRFRAAGGAPRDDELLDWGLAARFSDWDGDGDPDLYVANDFNSPDGIWLNRGDGTFDRAPDTAIRTTSLSSMAVDLGDVDRDGDLDLVTTDMLARERGRRLSQVPSFVPGPEGPGVIETRLQVNRNALQLNRGDGTFAEVAHWAAVAASDWTWGAVLVDADLDGFEDLLVATGHAWDQLDGDTGDRLARAPGAVDWRRHLSLFPPLRQRNAAFRGRGDGSFEDVTERWGWGEHEDISHGIAAGDLDGDGDPDFVVTRLGDPPLLVRNASAAPRLLVRLRAPEGNTRGVGARVTLLGHPAGPQIEEIVAGGAYLSSPDPSATFAATPEPSMALVVDWPGGAQSRLEGVAGNREYEITPGSARASGPGPPPSGGSTATGGVPARAFRDVTASIGHRHVENDMDDRARQPLLPASLTRAGPGVTWLDVDADGDADLLVGSGAGGAPVLIANVGGRLGAPRPLGPALAYDATAIVGHPTTRGHDVLWGASAYEAPTPAAAAAIPVLTRLDPSGRGDASVVLEARPGAARLHVPGPLAQADIDGDGDLDLFAGGYAVAGRVPEPADSWMLVNDGGELGLDSARSAPFRAVGLVTGAVFSDFDADGDPDLALALAWGTPRLFRNDGGRFSDATAELGMGPELSGRWNGIAAGDLDADGRLDLVVTGWGTNLDLPPPYALFHGDFDRDGTYDVVEAERDDGRWRPVRGRNELAAGLRALFRISHDEYRNATLAELLGAGVEAGARIDVTESRHLVLLNRPGGFEPRPLPVEAQRAPAFGAAVGDLDGDGHEDIILAQNFYPVGRGVPRYDAGRGLWLRGLGDGSFEAVPGTRSGIAVHGDARGVALADYDLDGRVDLAFGVNGAETRVYRNELAAPGLRVVLRGSAGNPQAVGAVVSLEYTDAGRGPARIVTSGSGYWSRNEAPQTLGLARAPAIVRVRWPDGLESEHTIPTGASMIEIRRP